MKTAIMQPYVFPYLGYFQLISSVDCFVFYDDVNFIKRGWINRNKILVNGNESLFSIPLVKASQNKLINEIHLVNDNKWTNQFLNTIQTNYKKAPFFKEGFELVETVLSAHHKSISDLAIDSVIKTCDYLGMNRNFQLSSANYFSTKGLPKADRLVEITKLSGSTTYINAQGGKQLYDKPYFESKHVDLFFLIGQLKEYPQFENQFVPGLSMIDLIMFNDLEQINQMLNHYYLD